MFFWLLGAKPSNKGQIQKFSLHTPKVPCVEWSSLNEDQGFTNLHLLFIVDKYTYYIIKPFCAFKVHLWLI